MRRPAAQKLSRAFLAALFLPLGAAAVFAQDVEDWAASPEAYFLTQGERADWKTLDSGAARDRFKEQYWLKRDPTPGTEKNQFRDTVLARIKTADARFPIGKTPGSRTKRGFVFVVFGTPARVNDTRANPLEPPRPPQPGVPRNPVGVIEGNETTSVWIYDRERTPRLLQALGDRPSLEITFIIEPQRRKDEIQNPGLVDEYRETLAKKSIVNPDLIPPPGADVGGASPARPALPRAVLSAQTRALLEKAPQALRTEDGSVFGSAVVWGKSGDPETLVWFYLSAMEEGLTLHGLIKSQSGEEVAAVSEPAAPSSFFSTSRPEGQVVLRRLALPAGTYSVYFEAEGKKTRIATAWTLQVPDLSDRFAVSSLILSAGPGKAQAAPTIPFLFGESQVPPRADATFLKSESLWYFLEVANPGDPGAVTIETRLRRGAEQVGASAPSPAGLVEIAPGRYLCGFEMPLATIAPGDYTLYVTVRDGASEGSRSTLRRGDFRVKDPET